MLCPTCKDTPLKVAERQRVEIDYCPQCRGVWLDRGELDKIIDRAAADSASSASEHGLQNKETHHAKKRKKSSLFSELFDF